MITKQIAATLYGNSYMLQDKEGKVYGIHGVLEGVIGIYGSKVSDDKYIPFDKIGTEYHILARPFEMITNVINGVVPLEYMQNKSLRVTAYYIYKDMLLADYEDGVNVLNNWEEQYLLNLNFAIGLPEGSWIPVTEQNNTYAK